MKQKDIQEEIKDSIQLTDAEVRRLYEKDGSLGLYLSQNRKLNEVKDTLNRVVIDLDSDDKRFERWILLTKASKELHENVEYLKAALLKEYGIEQLTEQVHESSNVVEKIIKNKQQ